MHKTHPSLKHLPKPTISTSTLSQSQPSLSIVTNKPLIQSHLECVLFPTYALRNPQDPNDWIVRAKGWALSLRNAGPKQKVLKGIAKSVAGKNSANEISNKMFEHRFKYFLAKGKKNRQFRIQAIGSASCTEWQQKEEMDNSSSSSSTSSTSSSSATNLSTAHDYFTNSPSSLTPRDSFMYNDEESYARKHQLWGKLQDHSLEHQLLEPLSNTASPLSVILNASYSSSPVLNHISADEGEQDDYHEEDEEDIDHQQEEHNNDKSLSTLSATPQKKNSSGVTLKSDGTGVFSGQFSIHNKQIQKWHSAAAEPDDQQQSRIIRIKSEPSSNNTIDIKKNSVCSATFGIVNLIESNGISVISDIDDTIKDTRILAGARAVLKNTFYNPTRAVPGMANVYSQWYNRGASFHYVSNSPYQLVHMLYGFMSNHHFPPGSFHLRPTNGLFKNLVAKPGRSKRDSICSIMRDFPHRKFILIGDSGEIDLEIYTRIATEFPGQVLKIFIRDVTTEAAANKLVQENKAAEAKATKKYQKLTSKSASFPSFFTTNSPLKTKISPPRSSSTNDIDTHYTDRNIDHDNEEEEALPDAATKLAELVLEPSLTGHQAFADPATASQQPQSNSIIQLYSRLNQARRHVNNIDVILFKDAKELYNDKDIQSAMDTFTNIAK